MIQIVNSQPEDLDEIFNLYRTATDFQKIKSAVPWPEFDRELVKNEINENRQWKILIGGSIACIWATCFTDPLIWEQRNSDPAVYIHRIATSPRFRGNNFVSAIAGWAKSYAGKNNKQFIRMDTVGNNEKLIEYYKRCGFDFLGFSKLKHFTGLPAHYHNAFVALFEIKLNIAGDKGIV